MEKVTLGAVEARFADIIWKNAPIASGELAKIAEKELSWKRTTTYTVLKRLCERGLFSNDAGIVTTVISRDEFYSLRSEKFVEETFEGSLPAFIAAFTRRKELTREEIEQIREMIENAGKE